MQIGKPGDYIVYFGMGPDNDVMRHADGPIAVYSHGDAHYVRDLFGGCVMPLGALINPGAVRPATAR